MLKVHTSSHVVLLILWSESPFDCTAQLTADKHNQSKEQEHC